MHSILHHLPQVAGILLLAGFSLVGHRYVFGSARYLDGKPQPLS